MVPFEKVKIGKQGSVTHSHALLDVLHLDRTFLQCERHKDRELSLVLDLKPGSTMWILPREKSLKCNVESTLHFKDFSRGRIFHKTLNVDLNLGREVKPMVLPIL